MNYSVAISLGALALAVVVAIVSGAISLGSCRRQIDVNREATKTNARSTELLAQRINGKLEKMDVEFNQHCGQIYRQLQDGSVTLATLTEAVNTLKGQTATNGQTIGKSESYKAAGGMENGIASVKASAADAKLTDNTGEA